MTSGPESSDPHRTPLRFVNGRFWCRRSVLLSVLLAILLGPYLESRITSPFRVVKTYSIDMPKDQIATKRLGGQTIRVCCFNLAHGRGLAFGNTQGGGREERRQRLIDIANLIEEIDADIVVLNEVDFDSTWSFRVNQARFIAQSAHYPFVTEQRNLDFRFAVGSWRFGNAVLSRHPIQRAELVDLPAFKTWESLLAGKKRSVFCDIEVAGHAVVIGAIHLSHRSELLRVESARMLLDDSMDATGTVILAGDFNSTPSGFPDSLQSVSGENAMDVFDQSGRFSRRPVQTPTDEELTFRSNLPERTIDWILLGRDSAFIDYTVIDSELSDHRPVVATIDLQP